MSVEIRVLEGLDGARAARGTAVIIDVFRAFSLVPWALARGAPFVVPVMTAERAFAIRAEQPGCLIAGERDGRQIDGFDFGNSPTAIREADLVGRTDNSVTLSRLTKLTGKASERRTGGRQFKRVQRSRRAL